MHLPDAAVGTAHVLFVARLNKMLVVVVGIGSLIDEQLFDLIGIHRQKILQQIQAIGPVVDPVALSVCSLLDLSCFGKNPQKMIAGFFALGIEC